MENKEPLEEELRQSFIDETKNKLWSENGDNDCGFSEEYVFWLEQKILKFEQKQYLIDMMKDDEELGMHEETVEEAAQSYAKTVSENHTSHMLGFLNGAKWAQERSYSEKELLNILQHRDAHMNNYHKLWSGFQTPKEWLEHFKNK